MIGLTVLMVSQEHRMIADGLARYHALDELLGHHRMPDTTYSLVGSLFAAPLWWIGRHTGNAKELALIYNSALFCSTLAAIYLLLRRHVEAALLHRFLLLLVTGSMVAPHLVDFYGEMFTMSTVGVGLLILARPGPPRGSRLAAWTAIVLGVANTPASLLGLVAVAGIEAIRWRRIGSLAPVAVASALIAAESWLRRGSPFVTGYADNHGAETVMPYSGLPGFSYPLLLGVAAIVFSFGKGLLWFTPGLFLPVRSELNAPFRAGPAVDLGHVWLLWTTFTAGLVAVYAQWWAWYGGAYWGPRFFLIAILPASLGLAARLDDPGARLKRTVTVGAVLALSVWVAADGLAFGELWAWTCYQDGYRLEALCHFTPEFGALWYPLIAKPDLSRVQQVQLVLHAVVLVWLATPLAARLARDLREIARQRRPLFLERSWRW